MNAEQRQEIFTKLRYELRMSEGFADELNAGSKSVTEAEAILLMNKINRAHAVSSELVDAFKTKPPVFRAD